MGKINYYNQNTDEFTQVMFHVYIGKPIPVIFS